MSQDTARAALTIGVKIETQIEHALAVFKDMAVAALDVSWDTARAALSLGVEI